MIDMLKAKQAFKEYVKPYDITNKKVELKTSHTFRTADVSRQIAEELSLDKENILLAELIGLLHDIGRFEQIRIYDTFEDNKSIDHGNLGIKILFTDELIRNFVQETKYDDIIYTAIKNHNKFKIEEELDSQKLLHSKIIRDADKTDIFKIFVTDIEEQKNFLYNYNELSKQIISKNVLDKYKKHEQSNKIDLLQDIDKYINIISFIFDYNFKQGLNIIKENEYIDRIIKPITIYEKTKKQMEEIKKIANEYIEERLK